MKLISTCTVLVLLYASTLSAQVLGLPSRLVSSTLFEQTSPSTQPPTLAVPPGLSLEQYAYLTAQQAYLIGLLQRVGQELDNMRTLKQASDTVYMQRIGELEVKLGTLIEDHGTGAASKWTTGLSALGAGIFSAYTAANCKP